MIVVLNGTTSVIATEVLCLPLTCEQISAAGNELANFRLILLKLRVLNKYEKMLWVILMQIFSEIEQQPKCCDVSDTKLFSILF